MPLPEVAKNTKKLEKSKEVANMTHAINKSDGRVRLLHELLFSVYSAFLIVSAHEGGPQRWAIGLLSYGARHGFIAASHAMEDYRVDWVDFSLIWLSAILIFTLLRLFACQPFTELVLRGLAGIVAISGFPLACLYQQNARLFTLEAGLVISGSFLVVWLYCKRPVPRVLVIILAILYFALWTAYGGYRLVGGSFLLWPGWSWTRDAWKRTWLAYPLLGLCSTLLWAEYARWSSTQEDHQQ